MRTRRAAAQVSLRDAPREKERTRSKEGRRRGRRRRKKERRRPWVFSRRSIDDDGDDEGEEGEEDETLYLSPLTAIRLTCKTPSARALLTFLCRREVLAVRHDGELKEEHKEKKKKPTTTTMMGDGSRETAFFLSLSLLSLSAASFRHSPSLRAEPARAPLSPPEKEGEWKARGRRREEFLR